jgi:hypothetical protein
MTLKEILQEAVSKLDAIMAETPSREVADICNALQEMVDKL